MADYRSLLLTVLKYCFLSIFVAHCDSFCVIVVRQGSFCPLAADYGSFITWWLIVAKWCSLYTLCLIMAHFELTSFIWSHCNCMYHVLYPCGSVLLIWPTAAYCDSLWFILAYYCSLCLSLAYYGSLGFILFHDGSFLLTVTYCG